MMFRMGLSSLAVIGLVSAAVAEPDAKQILAASGQAVSKLHAISYKASAQAEGALAEETPRHTAMVTMSRAEAGGWKIHAQGEAAGAKGAAAPFELGYDSVTAWSIKEKEKAVYQKSTTKVPELEQFFKSQNAGPVIAFEMVSDKPMATEAAVVADGEAEIGGTKCDVVKVTGSEGTVRWFIARDDHLPRKVERIREIAGEAGAAPTKVVRALTLGEIKTDSKVVAAPFTVSVPEGYRIKYAGQTTAPKREEKKPDANNPLGGPGVKDKGDSPAAHQESGLLAVGSEAPEFTLKDAAGKDHNLSEYKGKVVVLDFWGTWCPWCIKAMPAIQRVHTKYKSDPVEVIGLDNENDPKADPAGFMKKSGYTYGMLLKSGTIAGKYKVSGWPTMYIVGADGKILWSHSGYSADLEQQLSKVIDEALKKK